MALLCTTKLNKLRLIVESEGCSLSVCYVNCTMLIQALEFSTPYHNIKFGAALLGFCQFPMVVFVIEISNGIHMYSLLRVQINKI